MARRRVKYSDEQMTGLILFIPVILVILIIIFVTDTEARPILQPILIAIAILLTILAGVITTIAFVNRNKKRKEFMRQIAAIEDGDVDTPPLSEDVLEEPTIQERSNRQVVKKKRKLFLNYRKRKLIYKESFKGKNCPICKLELRENQVILACPQCNTPFHEDHLISWMEKGNTCPVCDEAFTIIESEKEEIIRKEKSIIDSSRTAQVLGQETTLISMNRLSKRFWIGLICGITAISIISVMLNFLPRIPLQALSDNYVNLDGENFFFKWGYGAYDKGSYWSYVHWDFGMSTGGLIFFPVAIICLFISYSTLFLTNKRETLIASIFNIGLLLCPIIIYAIQAPNFLEPFLFPIDGEMDLSYSSFRVSEVLIFLAFFPLCANIPLYIMLLVGKTSVKEWYEIYWVKHEEQLSHLKKWRRSYFVLFVIFYLTFYTLLFLLMFAETTEAGRYISIIIFIVFLLLWLADLIINLRLRAKNNAIKKEIEKEGNHTA